MKAMPSLHTCATLATLLGAQPHALWQLTSFLA